jgi:hypothetical protein
MLRKLIKKTPPEKRGVTLVLEILIAGLKLVPKPFQTQTYHKTGDGSHACKDNSSQIIL